MTGLLGSQLGTCLLRLHNFGNNKGFLFEEAKLRSPTSSELSRNRRVDENEKDDRILVEK